MLARFSGQTLRAFRRRYADVGLLFAGFVTRMGEERSAEEDDVWGDGWG